MPPRRARCHTFCPAQGPQNATDEARVGPADCCDLQDCDHCETSERAYADIAPLLGALAEEMGKAPAELVIYDPYYCQGSTVERLASAGFPNVYNRNEDFYKVRQGCNGTVADEGLRDGLPWPARLARTAPIRTCLSPTGQVHKYYCTNTTAWNVPGFRVPVISIPRAQYPQKNLTRPQIFAC